MSESIKGISQVYDAMNQGIRLLSPCFFFLHSRDAALYIHPLCNGVKIRAPMLVSHQGLLFIVVKSGIPVGFSGVRLPKPSPSLPPVVPPPSVFPPPRVLSEPPPPPGVLSGLPHRPYRRSNVFHHLAVAVVTGNLDGGFCSSRLMSTLGVKITRRLVIRLVATSPTVGTLLALTPNRMVPIPERLRNGLRYTTP